eukprot:1856066-Amphidinium_carterae.1
MPRRLGGRGIKASLSGELSLPTLRMVSVPSPSSELHAIQLSQLVHLPSLRMESEPVTSPEFHTSVLPFFAAPAPPNGVRALAIRG